MRLGVDARELRRGSSTGIGRYLRGFLRYAAERLRDHSFVLYGDPSAALDEFSWAERRVLEAPWPFYDHLALPLALRRDRAELFFSPYYKAPWRAPCPTVVTIHDLMFMTAAGGRWGSAARNALERAAARSFAERAAAVITVSEYSKAEIVRLLGTDPAKISVVPNSVPRGFSPAEPARFEDTLARRGVPRGCVLYVGGLKASKNAGALVEAYAGLEAGLRASHPLVLVAPRDAEYSRFVLRHGAAAAAAGGRFLPSIGDRELVDLYSSCALCVVPSLIEGFGMPALEAMACGAPVLAANRASLPEVVGDAGELVEPEAAALREAIARLLASPESLEGMRRRGLARAAGFSYVAVGESLAALLRRCAGS